MPIIHVALVGGARPNFMKVAPIYRALRADPDMRLTLVHTGQHYDQAMSGNLFEDLGLPDPDVSLDVRSGSHGVQTARVLERFESVLTELTPDTVVVVGDVNSTVACALAAAKMVYPDGRRPRVAHVEAGLRSFDRTMPEEVNRIVTDALSNDLFTSEPSGEVNLRAEGVDPSRIHFVGNVMIDTLNAHVDRARERAVWRRFGFAPGAYGVVTLHRPANVDEPAAFAELLETLNRVGGRLPLVFPLHPRTLARMERAGDAGAASERRVQHVPPLAYLDFLSLMCGARLVLTDSGGIQEETTALGVPCLTLRANTERPITVQQGTNQIVGTSQNAILVGVLGILESAPVRRRLPDLWDGHAGERIAAILTQTVR